jgi:cell wall integrity and stress response component
MNVRYRKARRFLCMGLFMSIAALSTAGFDQFISASSQLSASQQAFQTLQQSLSSGNLSAAQAAFNTYNHLNQSAGSISTSSSSSSSTSKFSTDLAALGTAIGSGSVTSAQSAFTTLQGDLKTTPSQTITNAEAAVAQSVQWVDDLLNLSGSSTTSTTTDPASTILDSAYGLSSSSSTTDPTTSLLESAYGNTGSSTGATTATTAESTGNAGNSASVNAYA